MKTNCQQVQHIFILLYTTGYRMIQLFIADRKELLHLRLMCGISGAVIIKGDVNRVAEKINESIECLARRGPDAKGIYRNGPVVLGHRRLSIIDTAEEANQPFSDSTGRYTIIFNGEFFNFREHRDAFIREGIQFRTTGDTEVLLQLYIKYGKECLNLVNGFFAFAVYDKKENKLFIARDRFGIKPLYCYRDENLFCFGSEIKALLAFDIPHKLDETTLSLYLQLNYVPGPWSMFRYISQLKPGYAIDITLDPKFNLNEYCWYTIPRPSTYISDYKYACTELYRKMDEAVERRLVSDVPLGAFLSGGIDSSIITGLAAQKVKGLKTFSIGFTDEPLFDETTYAEKVAAHCKTDHHTFKLTTTDLLNVLPEVINYPGEPFADSSALAVYILSRETSKYVKVALSGDGGDELFAGYRKHRAEWMIRHKPLTGMLSRSLSPLLSLVKGSRQSKTGNRLRQLHRFAEGSGMNARERYWRWCSMATTAQVNNLLANGQAYTQSVNERTALLTNMAARAHDLNDTLKNDVEMVLPFDMLTKVDLMSMANSLEVRIPFLDYKVVEHAFSLPEHFKIDAKNQKKILKDTFGHLLPAFVFERKKQGFEVPLIRWLRTSLTPLLDEYLHTDLLTRQNLFQLSAVKKLRDELNTPYPGEATARMWSLLVFQHWWIKTYNR